MIRAAQWTLRALLAALLLASGVGKLLDNRAFAEIIATYQLGIPEPLLLPLGLAVSLVELGMGIAILAGIQLRWMAIGTIGVHVGYTALAALTNLRGLDLPNCGCFGVFLARPMTWTNVVEDAVLTLISIAFFLVVGPLARAGEDLETSDGAHAPPLEQRG